MYLRFRPEAENNQAVNSLQKQSPLQLSGKDKDLNLQINAFDELLIVTR